MFGSIGVAEVGVLAAVVAIVVWHRRLPQLGRDIGHGIRGLLRGVSRGD